MLANYAKYFLCGLSVLMLYGGFVNAAESDPVSPFLRGARGDRDVADRHKPQFDPASFSEWGLELGLISQNPSSPTNQPPLEIDRIDAGIPKNRVESINPSPISVTPATPTTPTTPTTNNQQPTTNVNEVLQQIEEYSPINQSLQESEPLEKVNSVFDLADVFPNDWAYSALESLAERYDCLLAYGDRTYRGDRAMTRYEFAASLDACLTAIQQQIEAKKSDITGEDLAQLQRLQTEFATELGQLRARIDNLEVRTAELEANKVNQSVTVFGGEAIFGLASAFGGDPPGTGDAQTAFHSLVRLQTVSTFSGKDRLRVEMAAGNFDDLGFASPQVLNTAPALLSYQADTDKNIQLSMVEYRMALGDRFVTTFRPVGFSLATVLTTNSPYFDNGRGAISRFGEANPVFKIGDLDAGVGFDWLISQRFRLQMAYGTQGTGNPLKGFGNADSNALGLQFLLLPFDRVLTGLTFVYGYSEDGRLNTFTGSAIADASGFINQRSRIYAASGTLQWRVLDDLTFSTWGGIVGTHGMETDAYAVSTNYMFALGLSDTFGRDGDLLAVMFGQPPKLVEYDDFDISSGLADQGQSYHIEAFYRFKINDKVTITPGFFMVTNPGNIEDNNNIYVGALRTTFRF
ncbi:MULTISPECIES: iron uptake porin [Planktothricoides]|uniref:Iron uptake porin n=1 Tax=Planktothricoides raciborskii GIHE-MW2 TaxID=2792601 RepID=A0AAU8J757_9CYAN|nr:iron uptake porin [Planktothricoides sp. SR001]